MDFKEAFKIMVDGDGRKVRAKCWNEGEYIRYDGFNIVDENGCCGVPALRFIDLEWEVFGEQETKGVER